MSKLMNLCNHQHNFTLNVKNPIFFCSRCIGIYGGVPFFILIFLFLTPITNWLNNLENIHILLLCYILTLPLVFDWLLQCRAIKHSSNKNRLITGLMTSLSFTIFLFSYNAYWITIPIGLIWYITIIKLGFRWRNIRPLDWGCSYCSHLSSLQKKFETNNSR